MSIIQVMDSTKSGRAIYAVAASLIVVGITIAIFQIIGQEFVLTLESSIGLVPIIGLLSLLLWIRQPDRNVIEHFTIKYIYKRKEMPKIKVRMASALLFVKPWESSPKSAFVIEESLRNELDRTLRSPELKEQIDNYKQAFWLILLTPFSLIVMVAFYQLQWWLMTIIGIVIGAILAFLLLRENRETLTRVIEYAFARWFIEGTSADLNRRKASSRIKSQHRDRLEASLELAKPVIDLAIRGDWRGFDRNSRNLEHLVGIPGYDTLTWSLVEKYLTFLDWCATHIHDRHVSHVDMFLKNGRIHVTSSISIFRECREYFFNEEEELVAKILQIITNYSENRETYLDLNVEFYEKLETEFLKNLKEEYLDIMGRIPFKFNEL